jgi:hypothetical protein
LLDSYNCFLPFIVYANVHLMVISESAKEFGKYSIFYAIY